jgi:hypothetical protein
VSSYPEPDDAIRNLDTKSAMSKTNPDRPKVGDLFEMEGRMSWIQLQKLEVGISKLLN